MKTNRVGRPTHCRSIQDLPRITCFKPNGVPQKELKSVLLTIDELEAIRLADKEGLYQADAAVQMNVSRPTFGRILATAHKKVAEAIVDGKQLCIQGGVIRSLCDTIPTDRPDICVCTECGLELPHLKGEPCRESSCPHCGASLKRKGGCMSEEETMSDTLNSPDKFNREAAQWDENPQRRAVAHSVAEAIIAAVSPKKSMHALEFGCGTGLVTFEIAPLVKTVSAIDTSQEMLAVLRDKIHTYGISNIEASCINLLSASECDLHENSFDLIYSSMTLHHIDDTAGVLNRISKLLSPGGILALADLDQEDGLFHDDPLEKVHHGFDRGALADLMKAAGLKPLAFETIYTFNKKNRSGETAIYSVFLVTATKIDNQQLPYHE